MTDLEMTRLCAEAMGLFGTIAPNGQTVWQRNSTKRYDPLHDNAQAMALVKKFGVSIGHNGRTPRVYQVEWWASGQSLYPSCDAEGEDLNRAIVECVAKMRQAKAE